MLPIIDANLPRLVRRLSHSRSSIADNDFSFLPESPRYLISKDRRDEAFDILAKYHAEGDRDSIFVKAEMAQIETTIKLELEIAKQSWFDMVKTPGMRRRTTLAACMGLFTQVSRFIYGVLFRLSTGSSLIDANLHLSGPEIL